MSLKPSSIQPVPDETARAALNALAPLAPDWLRTIAPPAWHDR